MVNGKETITMKKLLISIGILCAVCLGGFGMQSLKANADVLITETEETIEEVVEEIVVEEVVEETTEEITPTAVVLPGATYTVQGTLYWQDDNGRVHPLRYMQVEVRDKTNAESMGFVYTDANGFYQLSVRKATTIQQVYINVYPRGRDLYATGQYNYLTRVVREDDSEYYADSKVVNVFNQSATVNDVIKMEEEEGQAFQIAQAAITALHYAQEMGVELTVSSIVIEHPHNETNGEDPAGTGCFYNDSKKKICIEAGRYGDWDTVMHEVGHYVEYCLGIIDSPGGDHSVDTNCIDLSRFSADEEFKEKGIRLSWSEGWASFFGQQAQQYYASRLLNIKDANGQDFHDINLESPDIIYRYFGEGGEATIIGLFYDLYDDSGTDESWDTIALGHQNIWDYAADSQATTFSAFSNYLCENNLVAVAEYGKLLSYYNMTASTMEMTEISDNLTFTWNESGGSVRCPNNRFTLLVYPNTSTTEVIRVENITAHTYTLTDSEQNDILYTNGLTFRVAVIAYQTTNTLTGGYQSQEFTFTKPTDPVTVSKVVSVNTPHIEIRQNVSPGQKLNIMFALTDGSVFKLIQTFGHQQPLMTIKLYQGDTLLAQSNGAGYDTNALVHYYLQAKTQYRIEIGFYNQNIWGILGVLISSVVNTSGQTVEQYEQFGVRATPNIGATDRVVGLPLYRYNATAFLIVPQTTGIYKITLTGNFAKSIRIVEPRNPNMELATGISEATGTATSTAVVGGELTANIPYLIFYWQTGITATLPSGVTAQIVIEGLSS